MQLRDVRPLKMLLLLIAAATVADALLLQFYSLSDITSFTVSCCCCPCTQGGHADPLLLAHLDE